MAGAYRGTFEGTGSEQWDRVVLAVGKRLRERENPHQNDYHPLNYSDEQHTAAADAR